MPDAFGSKGEGYIGQNCVEYVVLRAAKLTKFIETHKSLHFFGLRTSEFFTFFYLSQMK